MKILIENAYRSTTSEEMNQFNPKLFRIIDEVAKRVKHNQYHYWYVEIRSEPVDLQAGIRVDIAAGNNKVPYLIHTLNGSHNASSIASAEGSVSSGYSDEVVQKVIDSIVKQLEEHLDARQP